MVATHHAQGQPDLSFFVKPLRIERSERRVRRWQILNISVTRVRFDRVLLSPHIRQSTLRRARVVVTVGRIIPVGILVAAMLLVPSTH